MRESSRKLIHSVSESLPEGRLLLAFSGGSDSLALLYILSLVAGDRSAAVYVNHRIRDDAELQSEIELNRQNAERLGIPFSLIELEPGEIASLAVSDKCGVEAAARQLRYRRLEEYRKANGFDYILTAHHREDQVESVIMRLLDSSPFYSLSGIRMRDGVRVRPLLMTAKRDIMAILEDAGLSWSEDSTNSDDEYKRNSVRHNIVPLLSERERTLISGIASNVACYAERNGIPVDIEYSYYAEFSRTDFVAASELRAESTVYAVNSYFGNRERVSRAFISDVRAKAAEGRGRMVLPSMSFYFLKDRIRAYPPAWDFCVPYRIGARIGQFYVTDGHPDDRTLIIDQDLLTDSAVIRTSRECDVIELRGGRKKVSELEKEYRIPYSIVLEDRNGIVAVFARVLGGKDRLSAGFIGCHGSPVSVAFSPL